MVSEDILKIYFDYNGDMDLFVRTASKSELQKMNDDDWLTIENSIQNIKLIEGQLTSKDFEHKTIADINYNFSPDAIDLIFQFARRKNT